MAFNFEYVMNIYVDYSMKKGGAASQLEYGCLFVYYKRLLRTAKQP